MRHLSSRSGYDASEGKREAPAAREGRWGARKKVKKAVAEADGLANFNNLDSAVVGARQRRI